MMSGRMRQIARAVEEKPENRTDVIWRLLKLLSPYKGPVILSFVFTIITAASQGASPYLIGRAVDEFIGAADASGLAQTMTILVVVYLAGMIATRYQIYLVSEVGQKLLADLRQSVFKKIQSLSLQDVETKLAGDLMSRLVNDIDALNSFFSQALTQMIGALFSLIGIIVAMIALSWQLGLAVLIMLPILWLLTNTFSKWAREAFRRTRETIGDVSAELEEELGGVKVAQAFNRTDENIRRFSERNAANRDANITANAVTSAFAPVLEAVSTLDLALVTLLGGFLAIQGTITVGVVVAFFRYVQNFFRPLQTVAQLWTLAQSALAAAERVFDLLDTNPAFEDQSDSKVVEKISGFVEFDNVSFAYNENSPVLEDVSLKTEPGKTYAIVGPTGAGKTTLVNLIARFYEIKSGSIKIDGYPIETITQKSLRSRLGMVTQDPFLFSGSIFENINYGKLDASNEEVYEAARIANAHQFIQNLPEGYDTLVGERGKLLSQGQRQLIAIARAILADPDILILDEATASIDTRTEILIQSALQKLLKGRTSFVIAHRLSTIRNANKIYVIDKNEIVEQGTHDELIEQGGLYADLYKKQFYYAS